VPTRWIRGNEETCRRKEREKKGSRSQRIEKREGKGVYSSRTAQEKRKKVREARLGRYSAEMGGIETLVLLPKKEKPGREEKKEQALGSWKRDVSYRRISGEKERRGWSRRTRGPMGEKKKRGGTAVPGVLEKKSTKEGEGRNSTNEKEGKVKEGD